MQSEGGGLSGFGGGLMWALKKKKAGSLWTLCMSAVVQEPSDEVFCWLRRGPAVWAHALGLTVYTMCPRILKMCPQMCPQFSRMGWTGLDGGGQLRC